MGRVNVSLTLTDEQVEAIATRVAEIVIERTPADRAGDGGYMGVRAASEYLGVSEGRLRKLVERRQVPHFQEGRGCRVTFSVRDLDAWMEERRVRTA